MFLRAVYLGVGDLSTNSLGDLQLFQLAVGGGGGGGGGVLKTRKENHIVHDLVHVCLPQGYIKFLNKSRLSRLLLHCCLTSTEARWLIRDRDRVEGDDNPG